jgi:hypothetical protein
MDPYPPDVFVAPSWIPYKFVEYRSRTGRRSRLKMA